MTVGCHVGGAGVERRGQERVGWAHWFLASVGQPASAWQGIRHAQAGCLVSARWGVILVVADLPGDLAEAGRGEAGRALRHGDVGASDGVQVEVLVQGAEDAGGRLSGAGWVAG